MKQFLVILMVMPCILSRNIHLNEITPEEAQKFFTEQSLDLNYAKKLNEVPLPQLRSETGRDYYTNGRLIDNPEDYIEETYEAQQFHGQDGLGRAMFGYTDVNQARLEARNANGDVRGSYQYVDATGENIIVQYWSDALGFHQTDNRPKIILETVTETAEVQAARLEHERAWKEAARAAKVNPDPNSDFYNRRAIEYDSQVEGEASEAAAVSVSNEAQSLNRYPQGRSDESVAESQVDAKSIARSADENDEEVEIPSVPRGFFYKFDYPVQVIAETPSRRALRIKQAEHEGAPKVRRHDEAIVKPVVVHVEEKIAEPEVKAIVVEAKPVTKELTVEKPVVPVTKELSVEKPVEPITKELHVKKPVVPVTKESSVEKPVVPVTKELSVEKPVVPVTKELPIEKPIEVAPGNVEAKPEVKPEFARVSLKATEEGAIPADAVHDAQVHPKQKSDLVNSQVLPVVVHDD